MLAVYHDSVTELSCDMLVLPFDVPSDHITTGIYLVPITHAYVHSLSLPLSLSLSPELNRVLQVGGPDLMIEMSLLEDCLLGENLLTSGHLLPAQSRTSTMDTTSHVVFTHAFFIVQQKCYPVCRVRGRHCSPVQETVC